MGTVIARERRKFLGFVCWNVPWPLLCATVSAVVEMMQFCALLEKKRGKKLLYLSMGSCGAPITCRAYLHF